MSEGLAAARLLDVLTASHVIPAVAGVLPESSHYHALCSMSYELCFMHYAAARPAHQMSCFSLYSLPVMNVWSMLLRCS